jgi:peptidoglycan/xylan/chitin deacetylase (PgdA/CDA1 family)
MSGPIAHVVTALARATGRAGVVINEHALGREETVRLVDVLHRSFEFISLDELPARMESPRRLPFCLLTFDDGKKSNATVTAPILQSLGIPAAFYVITDFLSHGEPLWFDSYEALLQRVKIPPPGLEREVVKNLPHRLRGERLQLEMERHRVRVPMSEHVQPMSWDDARRLARQGFVIGAHGTTHAILTQETREIAFREIEASLALVGRELGGSCRTFAFPNGNYDEELAQHAVACGAATVMTTDPAWVRHRTPLWRLPRVQLYRSSTPNHIRLKVALAAIPGALFNPNGTGRAYVFSGTF